MTVCPSLPTFPSPLHPGRVRSLTFRIEHTRHDYGRYLGDETMQPSTLPSTTQTIIQGDCVEMMSKMPAASIDFILTDPPYLCSYTDRSGRSIRNDDDDGWLEPAYAGMFRVLRPNALCVTFYGWHRVDAFMHAWKSAGFRVVEHLVFVKSYDSSTRFVRRRHEQAYLLAKGQPSFPEHLLFDVFRWDYTHNRLHPTQKPIGILQPMVESFSKRGDCVLDPFCGSGSTLVAARQAGRHAIGVEIDQNFAAAARHRLGIDSVTVPTAA